MTQLISACLAALALATATLPAAHAHEGHSHDAAATALADGLIKKVDKAGGKLTIMHGPLPNGMPAMTMAFKVKEAAWLDKVREGQKIRFATEEVGGTLTVVRLEAAQ